MKVLPLAASVLLLFAAAVQAQPAPLPTIVSVVPDTAVAGSAKVTITVGGKNLNSGTKIRWNGTALPTTGWGSRAVMATVPAADLAAGGIASITLADSAGVSPVATFTITNPVPAVMGTAPAVLNVGTLRVNGNHFVPTSVIQVNGVSLPTTFVSSGSLQTSVPASAFVPGQSVTVSVLSPAPGGGASNVLTIASLYPQPVLISVFPYLFYVYGNGPATLSIAGSGFVPGSTVYWNSTTLVTTYVSQSTLSAAVPTSLYGTPPSGNTTVTVVNPGPGGGVSNGVPITETCNPPLSGTPPFTFVAGSPDQSIEVVVVGVIPAAALAMLWNGSPLTIQSVSANSFSTTVTAIVPAADLAAGGSAQVTVTDGCGSTMPINALITVPTPTLVSASPGAAYGVVGGSGQTVTFTGSNFLSSVTLSVDGSPRATTYLSNTQAQITLTAADVAAVGAHAITAINGGVGAVQSTVFYYTVGYTVNAVVQDAVDIAWDAADQVLYASSPYLAPDSILVIDPTSGNIVNTLTGSTPPSALAVSDDDSYLYVGYGQGNSPSIQRYTLPGLVPDISWVVGSSDDYAQSIAVAPGAPHTVSVVTTSGNISVYDDGVARSKVGYMFGTVDGDSDLAWKPDGSALFLGDFEYTRNLLEFGVDASGVTLATTYDTILPQDYLVLGLHFDAQTGYIFTNDGVVIDPSSGTVITKLIQPGTTATTAEGVALDDAAGKLYVAYQGTIASRGIYIVSYDLATLTPTDTAFIFTYYSSGRTHLLRWGAHGLALLDGGMNVITLQGDFIK